MKSREYLISQLEKLSQQFPELSFGFAFDNNLEQYIIQVHPAESYFREDYGKEESSLIFDFVKNFPCESILFIPKGSEEFLPQQEFEIKRGVSSPCVKELPVNKVNAITVIKSLPYAYPLIPLTENVYWLEVLKMNSPKNTDPVYVDAGENTYAMAA